MLRTPKEFQGLREISLFSGAGGGVLAAKVLGWETVAYVEWEKYPQKVLAARQKDGLIDEAPVFGDVREFDGTPYKGKVEVVSGGFPCQPFSVAGRQAADADERNMWPDTIRIVREVEPEYAFLENVPGLLSASHGYFSNILIDLAEAGYEATWDCVPASAVGAPHRRDRLWIFARKAKPVGFASRGLGRFAVLDRSGGKPEWRNPDTWGSHKADWSRNGVLLYDPDGSWAVFRLPRLSFPDDLKTKYGVWPIASLLHGNKGQPSDDRKMWMTPNTFDATAPKSQKALDHEATHRPGRASPNNLRDQVNVEEGNAIWPTPRTAQSSMYAEDPETLASRGRDGLDTLAGAVAASERDQTMFPTPTAQPFGTMSSGYRDKDNPGVKRESLDTMARKGSWPDAPEDEDGQRMWATPTAGASKEARPTPGMAARAARRGGPANLIEDMAVELYGEDREMWPTPDASSNRKSTRAMTASKDNGRRSGGGQSSPPGLEQAVELAEGIIPKELEDVNPEDLPEATRKMYPTPRANDWKGADMARDENRSGARHGGDDLATRVEKDRLAEDEEERRMWPTPAASEAGSKDEYLGEMTDKEGNPPKQNARIYNPRTGKHCQVTLGRAVKLFDDGRSMYPTPSTTVWPNEGNVRLLRQKVLDGEITREEAAAMLGGKDPFEAQGNYPAHESTGEEREMYPTPVSSTGGRASGSASRKEVEALKRGESVKHPFLADAVVAKEEQDAERDMWPTPRAAMPGSRPNGNGGKVLSEEVAISEGDRKRGETITSKPSAMLNPDWVEWLMGWPVGWTRSEPQSKDIFDHWASLSVQARWWHQEPPGIPRVTTDKTDRVQRLKALGNGQVSLCAAAACVGLYDNFQQIDEQTRRNEEGYEMDLDEFFGL